jgi:purine-binding chemotaxis protein CheW
MQLVLFGLDSQRYALPLDVVERVVRAAAVIRLPGAPAIVHGAIDIHGEVLPVLSLRCVFRLRDRGIEPDDEFLVARTRSRLVALVIDSAHGVMECDAGDVITLDGTVPGLDHVRGLARLEDGLVLIHDLENVLSSADAEALDQAMERCAS